MLRALKSTGIALGFVVAICFTPSANTIGMQPLIAAGNIGQAAASMPAVAGHADHTFLLNFSVAARTNRSDAKSNVKVAQTPFCKRVFAACAASAAAACLAQCAPPGTARCKSCVDRYADKCARDSG